MTTVTKTQLPITDGKILIFGWPDGELLPPLPDLVGEDRMAPDALAAALQPYLDRIRALPETAWRCCPVDIRGPDRIHCAKCDGAGKLSGQLVECDVCDGSGYFRSELLEERYSCPACDGDMVLTLPGLCDCTDCDGWGWLQDDSDQRWAVDGRVVSRRYLALIGLHPTQWAALPGDDGAIAWRRPDGAWGLVMGIVDRSGGQSYREADIAWGPSPLIVGPAQECAE